MDSFDPRALIGTGGIPLVIGLVEIVKASLPSLPARFYPALALTFGVMLNLGLAWVLHLDYGVQTVIGLLAGLAASKTFEMGKARESL